MKKVDVQIVGYDTALQKKSVEVRYKVLREPLGLVYTAEQLADEKDEIHIVALNRDEVIGVLVLKIMDNTWLKMRQVAVDQDWQKQGIGNQLVRFAEQYAKEHKYCAIELHARDLAKDFYLKLNYIVEGDSFVEVGILHYKMIKYIL